MKAETSAGWLRIPHIRGGDPFEGLDRLDPQGVFPTNVGVILGKSSLIANISRIPHEYGGDPLLYLQHQIWNSIHHTSEVKSPLERVGFFVLSEKLKSWGNPGDL